MRLQDSIRSLKGVGDKTEKLLHKLGITTIQDLILYYPREYDLYEPPIAIRDAKENQKTAIQGFLNRSVQMNTKGKNTVVTTQLQDGRAMLSLIWFHMPFLRSVLKKGSVFIFRGKIIRQKDRLVMEQPEIYTPAQYEEKLHSMQPIYSLTKGLSNKALVKLVKTVLEEAPEDFQEYLPNTLLQQYSLEPYWTSICAMHFPITFDEFKLARRRLAFDEFLLFILGLGKLKEERSGQENPYPLKEVWTTENVMENLPYRLTQAQMQVWTQVEQDLKGNQLMSRLIQGDVGSGKTILAFLAMIMVAENGYQSALMVPTEVLAQQHYESLIKLLGENNLELFQPVLLTGSTKGKARKEIYSSIESGTAKMIIGTHALFQEKVHYDKLALVITDEQHRFGVNQRKELAIKGGAPNVLVMSATPIPRTLAIILYGDLDISVIDELPANRLPIKNCVVNTGYRPQAYRFIEKEISKGHQIYIICPMIEPNEESDLENVTEYGEMLRKEYHNSYIVDILHGKMSPDEKNQIMERFASGETQILVSTTVIEVGINVPNATVMMIENAERFGLAQLHQLRGRVGRGDAQSYCIFMQGQDNEETVKRLSILNSSNDGFEIAAKDMELRGPGDLLGVRQSGMMDFKIADIYQDRHILAQAQEAAGRILSSDFDLVDPENQGIKLRLDLLLRGSLSNQSI